MPERFNPTPYEEAKKSDNTRSAIKHGVNSGSIVFNTASTRVNLLANHPNNPVSETTISASRERESTSSSGLTTGESLAPQISDKISDGENQVLIPQEHSYIAGTSKVGVELTGALTATPQATIAQNMELSVVARAGRDRDRFVDPEGIDQRIKVLREQGLGRAEIGRVLSISRGKVNHSVNMLIKSGEIPKKEGGRGSKEEIMAFDAQVKSLVAGERRVNIKELSERMRASYMKVRSSIHRLVEAKELPAELLGKGRQNSKRTQISLDIELSPKRGRSDIDSQVAELRAQGLFEIEIAEQLNEPRGKIRYAIRKLLKEGSISKLSESHPEFRKKQEYTKTRLGPGPTRIKYKQPTTLRSGFFN